MGVAPGKQRYGDRSERHRGDGKNFYRAVKMPTNLKELGIDPTEEQLETMAKNARKAAGGPKGSAKKLDAEDMLKSIRWRQGNKSTFPLIRIYQCIKKGRQRRTADFPFYVFHKFDRTGVKPGV